MGININIATKFDSKGLRLAKKDLANATKDLKNSTASLGKNFAVLGAGLVGVGALISKNAKSLARIEAINAQTDATIKSMGNTAGISAEQIQKLAGSLEAVTATEAETIQEGANLLLTFKNIKNEAGAGNDIFNQTTTAMVDLARAMGTDASGEAIRLGKALNDPVKGISALTRVGVSFTEQQKTQIKALAESGDLMGAQKVILAELQAQFGGSGAAYAKTFSGQLELMGHELGNVGEEATLAVMPALQNMVAQLRLLIPVIGPQLKAAIESVNWQELVTSVISFTTFLVQNGKTIATVVATLWTLSTILKIVNVIMATSKLIVAAYTAFTVAQTAATAGATVATGAMTAAQRNLNLAMMANPIAAVITALIALGATVAITIDQFKKFRNRINDVGTALSEGDKNFVAFGLTAMKMPNILGPVVGIFQQLTKWVLQYTGALNGIPKSINTNVNIGGLRTADAMERALTPGVIAGTPPPPGPSASKTSTGLQTINKTLAQEITKQNQFTKLTEKLGLSQGLAGLILGGKDPIKTAKSIIQGTSKAAAKLQAKYNKSAAGIAEIAQIQANADTAAAAAAEKLKEANQQAADALAEQTSKEMAILEEKERVYNSFLDSVKQTFSAIKNSIMGAFSLPELGTSTSGIIRNMEKMLVKVRSFAANVAQLSTMGLDPALLNQVISAGPMAGSKLAAGLVAGGVEALSTINAGFAEIGALSSAIATTGTEAAFGTAAQQTIYNINVDGGVGSGSTIGKAIVDAIKAYERTSGAVWQGA